MQLMSYIFSWEKYIVIGIINSSFYFQLVSAGCIVGYLIQGLIYAEFGFHLLVNVLI